MRYILRNFASYLYVTFIIFNSISAANANSRKIGPEDNNKKDEVSIAKIYFSGSVNGEKVGELIQAIDDANINYRKLKRIYLYINSDGGDMDSGYAGYWAVKSSRTPVTTVNMGMVMSSASMIFCGADDRQSLKGGRFILHPASVSVGNAYVQPDQLQRKVQQLDGYNAMFRDVYKECTKLSEQEIADFLHAENQRRFMLPDEARQTGLIAKIADKIMDSSVSYFVTDTNKNTND
ncbi:ATP-dependent Clp protease protease subunit [Ochrobactrum sp. RC6B]|nr:MULTISPECIES: ATP-dependent Clp protease proteolytic subunit [Brucella/Ochrobactrum group]MBB3218992.1 ATP-dependent Clp protease protease subunit [Ochrobactrum sp. RC6B]